MMGDDENGSAPMPAFGDTDGSADGREIGGYRADAQIGVGGSARVYRGRRIADGYPVALKVFREGGLAAARREAALAAMVGHQHVLPIIDVLADGEGAVLVTELEAGGSLDDLVRRRGVLRPAEVITALIPLADVLAAAHEHGLVHGDVTAANVLFDAAGRPLLADLGAARAAADAGLPVRSTPPFAAPELARGAEPAPAGDVFALGGVALFALTGRPPWPADDLHDVMIQATAGQWPDPGDLPGWEGLVVLVRAMLDADPVARPPAARVALELRAAGKPEPVDLAGGPAADPGASIRAALTRLRADAVTAGGQRPPPGRWRRAHRPGTARSGAHQRPQGPRARLGPAGIAAVVGIACAVVVVAVFGGLWWAGADAASPQVGTLVQSTSAAAPSPTGQTPAPGRTDWVAVIRTLDEARSRAIVDRDAALLEQVYAPGAPARATDVATITALRSAGRHVSGAAHSVYSVSATGVDGRFAVTVVDALPSYRVLDERGETIGSTIARERQQRIFTVVATPAGFRIASVGP